MNGFGIPCGTSPLGGDTTGCHSCRVTAFPGEFPAGVLCMSSDEYRTTHFDPDVVGPPGTCWLFTLPDVDFACGVHAIPGLWWIQPFIALGFYVWQVPMRWIRANVSGTIGTEEIFVHALSVNAGTDTSWVDSTALHDIAIVYAAAFDAWMTEIGGSYSTDVTYREVGCSLLEQTSVGGDTTTVLISEFAPINGETGRSGGSSAIRLPNECSPCVTLDTGVRGRRGRGRVYLPPPLVSMLTTDGKFTNAFADDISSYWFENMIPALSPSSAPYSWAVRSGKDLALYDVTGIRVGHVVDAQRRRRNRQNEAYSIGV